MRSERRYGHHARTSEFSFGTSTWKIAQDCPCISQFRCIGGTGSYHPPKQEWGNPGVLNGSEPATQWWLFKSCFAWVPLSIAFSLRDLQGKQHGTKRLSVGWVFQYVPISNKSQALMELLFFFSTWWEAILDSLCDACGPPWPLVWRRGRLRGWKNRASCFGCRCFWCRVCTTPLVTQNSKLSPKFWCCGSYTQASIWECLWLSIVTYCHNVLQSRKLSLSFRNPQMCLVESWKVPTILRTRSRTALWFVARHGTAEVMLHRQALEIEAWIFHGPDKSGWHLDVAMSVGMIILRYPAW